MNKNLVTIKYNSLNLPDVVQRGDGNMVDYSYDALGRKEEVKRVTVVGSGISLPIGRTLNDTTLTNVTKYTENVRYAANVTYDNNAMTDIQIPGGYLKRTDMYTNSSTRPVYAYCYYVNDHLGNIRAVIDGTGAIKQVNNYTPFGTEYGESAPNSSMYTYQNYQYGGKEFDRKFELNLSDFGARTYDAAKGRWTTPDPLAEKYYSVSPYVYCGNNPLRYVDPTGMRFEDPDELVYKRKEQLNNNLIAVRQILETNISDDEAKAYIKLAGAFQTSLNEIDVLDKSDVLYSVHYGEKSETSYLSTSGAIDVSIKSGMSMGAVAQELKHAFQYENRQISFMIDGSPGSLYDITDETESFNAERSTDGLSSVDYFLNKPIQGYPARMSDDDVIRYGKTMDPPAYQGKIPTSPFDINSQTGKALRQQTIEAGRQNNPISEVYKGWQNDYFKKGR